MTPVEGSLGRQEDIQRMVVGRGWMDNKRRERWQLEMASHMDRFRELGTVLLAATP